MSTKLTTPRVLREMLRRLVLEATIRKLDEKDEEKKKDEEDVDLSDYEIGKKPSTSSNSDAGEKPEMSDEELEAIAREEEAREAEREADHESRKANVLNVINAIRDKQASRGNLKQRNIDAGQALKARLGIPVDASKEKTRDHVAQGKAAIARQQAKKKIPNDMTSFGSWVKTKMTNTIPAEVADADVFEYIKSHPGSTNIGLEGLQDMFSALPGLRKTFQTSRFGKELDKEIDKKAANAAKLAAGGKQRAEHVASDDEAWDEKAPVPQSLENIGKELDLTRERVRQIEAGAKEKLKAMFGVEDLSEIEDLSDEEFFEPGTLLATSMLDALGPYMQALEDAEEDESKAKSKKQPADLYDLFQKRLQKAGVELRQLSPAEKEAEEEGFYYLVDKGDEKAVENFLTRDYHPLNKVLMQSYKDTVDMFWRKKVAEQIKANKPVTTPKPRKPKATGASEPASTTSVEELSAEEV